VDPIVGLLLACTVSGTGMVHAMLPVPVCQREATLALLVVPNLYDRHGS